MVPKEYLQVDPAFLEKPGKLHPGKIKTRNLPLAGRLSEIGQTILTEGAKKAGYICTGNWEDLAGQKDDTSVCSQKTNMVKVTDYNAFTHIQKPKAPKFVLKVNQEEERIKRALKTGRITPLENQKRMNASVRRPADIFTKPLERAQFEVEYSPKREDLIRRMKEVRNMRKDRNSQRHS